MKTKTEKETLKTLRALRWQSVKELRRLKKNYKKIDTSIYMYSYELENGYKTAITQAIRILNNEINKREFMERATL